MESLPTTVIHIQQEIFQMELYPVEVVYKEESVSDPSCPLVAAGLGNAAHLPVAYCTVEKEAADASLDLKRDKTLCT